MVNLLEKYDDIRPPYMEKPFDKNMPQERIFGDFTPDPENLKHHDVNSLATAWLSEFNEALSSAKSNPDALDKFLMPHTIWRDHQSLQRDMRSYLGQDKIKENVKEAYKKIGKFELDKLADYRAPTGVVHQVIHEANDANGEPSVEWIMLYLKYENDYATGRGAIRLVSVKDDDTPIGLKAFTIYTVLDEFASVPERVGKKRPLGVNHGENMQRKTWMDIRREEMSYNEDHQPVCVVVGGGQGGVLFAARMKSFGYNVLIIEKNKKIGDTWAMRYEFLALHDPFFYHRLPYLHSDTAPVFPTKDQFAQFLDCYAKILELNVWTDTTVTGASFDEEHGQWNVTSKNNTTGEVNVLNPKHVVFATGHSGEPNIPKFPGEEKFKGTIVHSSQHTTGAAYKGKKALVIGACNSAHDICQDFHEQGIGEVTMLQRSSTCVISSDYGVPVNCRGVYDAEGPNIDTADLILHSMPLNLTNMAMQQNYRESSKLDAKLLKGLEDRGFKTNAGMGGTGLFGLYYRRGSGYYIDVGCSQLIIDGKVKLKNGSIKEFTENGVILNDGTVIDDLDVVVKATGYSNMKDTAKRVLGEKVSEKLKPVWHFDEEGEFNAIWRDSGHPNFWFMGGNLAIARYYSKRLALRIISQEEGIK